MSKRTNRREQIIQAASELFIKHGYSATAVRQIANQVGCTEAAIYYHFKDGKRELFQAVLESNMPDLMNALESSRGAGSLYDFIIQYGQELAKVRYERAKIYRWITAEIPQLNVEECVMLQQKHTHLHDELGKELERFIANPAKASHVAWILTCVVMGYTQLFISLDLESVTDVTPIDLINVLAESLSADS